MKVKKGTTSKDVVPSDNEQPVVKEKKKRGRKKKIKTPEEIEKENNYKPKRRGRKPKNLINNINEKNSKLILENRDKEETIILNLKIEENNKDVKYLDDPVGFDNINNFESLPSKINSMFSIDKNKNNNDQLNKDSVETLENRSNYQSDISLLSENNIEHDINIKNFKQIKNNIQKFIGYKQYKKNRWFSLKDLLIHNNSIFVSYTEEIKENCWNTSLLKADMNFDEIYFEKIFSTEECIHSENNLDNEFNAHQSGGRIFSLNQNNILFSTGDYRSRFLAQDDKSLNGKIIQI